jgi:hypothetical protein
VIKATALSLTLLPLGAGLITEYSADVTRRVETRTSFSMETVESTFEIDGEPVDRGGRGGGSMEESRAFVTLDTVLETADGVPSRVRRVFDSMESSGSRMFGEDEMEIEHELPLNGVTLEISEEETKVTDGDEPEDDAVLEGHAMTLALDALLPAGELEVGDSWELEGEQILRALSMDLEQALFVTPVPEWQRERSGEGERRGRRRGGRRGGGSPSRMFAEGEWAAKATLESLEEEHESGVCAKIALELNCSGDFPEPEMGGGGRRAREPRSLGTNLPTALPLENTFEVELEGALHFHLETKQPVQLELRGTLSTQRTMERSTERGDFFMYTAQEGEFEHTVHVSILETEEKTEDSE